METGLDMAAEQQLRKERMLRARREMGIPDDPLIPPGSRRPPGSLPRMSAREREIARAVITALLDMAMIR